MSNERLYRSLYAKSLRYLGMRLRSEKEVRDKLVGWIEIAAQYGKPKGDDDFAEDAVVSMTSYGDEENSRSQSEESELVEQVLAQLKRERFLDDERFAKEWVISRLKRGKRGPAVIKMELRQKGVEDEVVSKVLMDVEQEEEGVSEAEGAMKTAEKYLRKLNGRDEREQKMKLYAYLRGKGFSGSVVAEIVKELLHP